MTNPLPIRTEETPGSAHALRIFHRAVGDVRAYSEFLAEHGLDPATIRTAEHFAMVPPMTKANYLRKYPRPSLMWHGDVNEAIVWSASSGSSGRPTYWPQNEASFEDNVELYDRIFRLHFDSREKSTVVVVGFAMGNWIGGTLTLRVTEELRRRGHRLSIVTPGLNDTILSNVAELGPHFDQIVLAGYPPFIQNVIDRAGPEVLEQDVKILLAGERIAEQWRNHILNRIGRPDEPERICLIYGTADAGVMGHETPTTTTIRRLADSDPALASDLFGTNAVLPTFVEYDPILRYTEVDEDGFLLFTVDTGVPLIRYRINDHGAVLTCDQVAAVLKRHGYCLPIATTTPDAAFLVLRRRSDVATSFYAVKIFPENIAAALEEPEISAAVTGKFVLSTRTDEAFAQSLDLRVELREKVLATPGFIELLTGRVVAALDRTNSEFRQLRTVRGDAAVPRVTPEPFGSARFHFEIKHRYSGDNA